VTIEHQVHGQFKLFTGPLAADRTLGALADQVTAFARDHKVAAKSIGVEYLESAQQLVLTLGYRTDEPAYPIGLRTVSLGKVETLDAAGLAALEQKMAAAAGKLDKIICHELYVTDDREFLMIFMTVG
jgi:hypothetical protein